MEELIIKIENDIRVNERCLQEEVNVAIRSLLRLWITYDEELLDIIKKVQNEKTI